MPSRQTLLCINDLPSSVDSEAYLFADDTKIFRIINNFPEILQDDLKQLETSENWLLKFNPEKCKHIHMQREKRAKCTEIQTTRQWNWESKRRKRYRGNYWRRTDFWKTCTRKNHSTFAAIRRSFKYLKVDTFLPLQIHGKIPSGLCKLSLGSIQKGDIWPNRKCKNKSDKTNTCTKKLELQRETTKTKATNISIYKNKRRPTKSFIRNITQMSPQCTQVNDRLK